MIEGAAVVDAWTVKVGDHVAVRMSPTAQSGWQSLMASGVVQSIGTASGHAGRQLVFLDDDTGKRRSHRLRAGEHVYRLVIAEAGDES